MVKIHSFSTSFSNEETGRLILKLIDGASFYEGHTQIELFSAANDLIARHELGGQLNFEPLNEVDIPMKALRRKYKGLITATIHTTFDGELMRVSFLGDKNREPENLPLIKR